MRGALQDWRPTRMMPAPVAASTLLGRRRDEVRADRTANFPLFQSVKAACVQG